MPSPFPGMDPYLESPDWFPDLHGTSSSHERVAPAEPARVLLCPVELSLLAGVHPAARRTRCRGRPSAEKPASGAGAAWPSPSLRTAVPGHHGRDHRARAVQAVLPGDPAAPRQGGPARHRRSKSSARPIRRSATQSREQFMEKQRKTLDSETHLVEIDLLRGGRTPLAVPQGSRRGAGRPVRLPGLDPSVRSTQGFLRLSDLHDSASPRDRDPSLARRPGCAARPSGGLSTGPTMSAPIGREIEYGKDPIVPRLKPEQAEWAADLLKQRRRRA